MRWWYGDIAVEWTDREWRRLQKLKGFRPRHSKLSGEDVEEILQALGMGTKGCEVAKRYGVCEAVISHIKHGRMR